MKYEYGPAPFENSYGETGGMAEEQYLGKVRGPEGSVIDEFEKGKSYRQLNKQEMARAIEKVKEFQPYRNSQDSESGVADPSEPSLEFANQLHYTICKKLGLEHFSQLEFYTAVGSRLDSNGIDGFFELYLASGGRLRVTFDGTHNQEKLNEGWKMVNADCVFTWPPLSRKENEASWGSSIDAIADMLIEEFKSKAKDTNADIFSLDEYGVIESKRLAQESIHLPDKKRRAVAHLRLRPKK